MKVALSLGIQNFEIGAVPVGRRDIALDAEDQRAPLPVEAGLTAAERTEGADILQVQQLVGQRIGIVHASRHRPAKADMGAGIEPAPAVRTTIIGARAIGRGAVGARPPIGAELQHKALFEIEIVTRIGIAEIGQVAVRVEQQNQTLGLEGQIGPVSPFDAAADNGAQPRDIGFIRMIDILEIGIEIGEAAGGVAQQIAKGIAGPEFGRWPGD